MTDLNKPGVLYLTRNGLLEPLGQSQILAYLKPLSRHYRFHILSFEKQKDLRNQSYVDQVRAECDRHNISWTPLHYRPTLRQLSILQGFKDLLVTANRICRQEKIRFVHARSYFPAFIALAIHKLQRVSFLFDMRALWPEELVSANRLQMGSRAYRLIKRLERKCLQRSAGVVSLTEAAVRHLDREHPTLDLKAKTTVIPTCTDIDRFTFQATEGEADGQTVISCIGTIFSGWFKQGLLRTAVQYLLTTDPTVRIEILTRDGADKVIELLDPSGRWCNRIHVESVPFDQVPAKLATHSGSMFFFNADISKLGSCPTRMGELLAAGVPVLANPGVGDVGEIISTTGVGTLIEGESETEVHQACDAFLKLIRQEGIDRTCREVAQNIFSLESGVARYRAMYDRIVAAPVQ